MDLALIIALVTAGAAIAAPVISEFIRSRSAARLKRFELFYASRVEAYQAFLSQAAFFDGVHHDRSGLFIAMNNAVFFSAAPTQQAIQAYYEAVILGQSGELLEKKRQAALTAMQKELREKPQRSRKRGRTQRKRSLTTQGRRERS